MPARAFARKGSRRDLIAGRSRRDLIAGRSRAVVSAMSPTRHTFESLGLPLVYYTWESAGASDGDIVLLHGYLDHALSFAPVAEALAQRWRVFAIDHRGHGDSGHLGAGGYYHFPDYVLDLAGLWDAAGLSRAHLIGHSMGASMACYFAGAFPERVRSLALLDGLGPPGTPLARGPALMRRWISDVKLVSQREDSPMSSLDDVADRLGRMSPGASRERLLALAATAAEEGLDHTWRWRFDPRHRTTAPIPFDPARLLPFLDAIECPTLLLWGEKTPLKPSDVGERKARLKHLTERELAGATHNLHHERPAELTVELVRFLAGQTPEAA